MSEISETGKDQDSGGEILQVSARFRTTDLSDRNSLKNVSLNQFPRSSRYFFFFFFFFFFFLKFNCSNPQFPKSNYNSNPNPKSCSNPNKPPQKMGSLATHFSAFLFLFPIGFRRLLCCFSLYLKSPHNFKSKPWYLSDPKWKTIDIYILLIALPIASFSDIFFFLSFSGHPTYRFTFFQESFVILMFWAFLILIILRENIDFYLINENFLFILASICFLLEYFVRGKEFDNDDSSSNVISNGVIPGVRVYELLCGLTLLCVGCCLYLAYKPTAFVADVILSCGILFKGMWILQAGLSLYTDAFSPKGCRVITLLPDEKTNVQCDLAEDGLRGVALMNLLFIGHATGILIMCLLLFGVLAFNRSWRWGSSSSLGEMESENLLMRPLPEVELE